MYRKDGRLDRELIDWRAGALISDLYQEIYKYLEEHPVVETIRLLERLHSLRGAVHGLSPGTEPVRPDGPWTDLAQLCEQAGWELSRLQLAAVRTRKAQEQRLTDIKARSTQEQRLEDIKPRSVQEHRLEDMGSIADQAFGETSP